VLEAQTTQRLEEALGRIAHLEATLAKVTHERDKLRRAYEQLKEHQGSCGLSHTLCD
jgi:chromosome segregation ATPase